MPEPRAQGYSDARATIALPLRGVAQLVERRSPKPDVAGSSPVAPATRARRAGCHASAMALGQGRAFGAESPVGRYWLANCVGFRVEASRGRRGIVERVGCDADGTDVLLVRPAHCCGPTARRRAVRACRLGRSLGGDDRARAAAAACPATRAGAARPARRARARCAGRQSRAAARCRPRRRRQARVAVRLRRAQERSRPAARDARGDSAPPFANARPVRATRCPAPDGRRCSSRARTRRRSGASCTRSGRRSPPGSPPGAAAPSPTARRSSSCSRRPTRSPTPPAKDRGGARAERQSR